MLLSSIFLKTTKEPNHIQHFQAQLSAAGQEKEKQHPQRTTSDECTRTSKSPGSTPATTLYNSFEFNSPAGLPAAPELRTKEKRKKCCFFVNRCIKNANRQNSQQTRQSTTTEATKHILGGRVYTVCCDNVRSCPVNNICQERFAKPPSTCDSTYGKEQWLPPVPKTHTVKVSCGVGGCLRTSSVKLSGT